MTEEYLLSRTLYGADIVQHILRKVNPDNILTVRGDDCGTYPDPVSGQGRIRVRIEVIPIEGRRLPERICKVIREDGTEQTAIEFASDFFQLKDEAAVIKLLSEELFIPEPKVWESTLTESQDLNPEPPRPQMPPAPRFSFFKRPIRNTHPCREASPQDIFKYLTSDYAKKQTETLRGIQDQKQRSRYKAENFDYITPAGIFASRKETDLIRSSGYMVIDFDHIPDPADLVKRIAEDWETFETVLAFRSPSGDGVKWIVALPNVCKPDGTPFTYGEYFTMLSVYSRKTYGVEADKSGKDICRACFLPYDPDAFINPFYIEKI